MTLARDLIRVWRPYGVRPHVMPTHLTSISRDNVMLCNAAFENTHHRKLHVEVGKVDAVTVIHSVMYPRPTFDVPILALDLVYVNDNASFGIVDCCPVTDDLRLPEDYQNVVRDIQATHGIQATQRTAMPEWGRAIFSNVCYMVRAPDPVVFCAYALQMARMHMEYCKEQDPSADHLRIRRNHKRFRHYQLQNRRTRTVLDKALGESLAAEYMSTVMFD